MELFLYQKRKRQETPYWPQSKGESGRGRDRSSAMQWHTEIHCAIKIERDLSPYKQKEMSPDTVTNGKAEILVTSHFFSPHFSSNLLTLHAKILV